MSLAKFSSHYPEPVKTKLPPNPDPSKRGHFPSWLHRQLPRGGALRKTGRITEEKSLPTVCEEAKCPNRLECYSKQTATFLAMGKTCTRACGFCSIDFSKTPPALAADEPLRISESVKALGLKHVVITMVARDDLDDGGAAHLVAIIEQLRKDHPQASVEVLTSDFNGNREAWRQVLEAKPEVFNHNLETVESLTPKVRFRATYERSLELLSFAASYKNSNLFVKSGIMVGLGESEAEVEQSLKDLKKAGCDIITIGQYLQATKKHLRVKTFVEPEQFKAYEAFGKSLGVAHMYCGPFVRSSYNADLFLTKTSSN